MFSELFSFIWDIRIDWTKKMKSKMYGNQFICIRVYMTELMNIF